MQGTWFPSIPHKRSEWRSNGTKNNTQFHCLWLFLSLYLSLNSFSIQYCLLLLWCHMQELVRRRLHHVGMTPDHRIHWKLAVQRLSDTFHNSILSRGWQLRVPRCHSGQINARTGCGIAGKRRHRHLLRCCQSKKILDNFKMTIKKITHKIWSKMRSSGCTTVSQITKCMNVNWVSASRETCGRNIH